MEVYCHKDVMTPLLNKKVVLKQAGFSHELIEKASYSVYNGQCIN